MGISGFDGLAKCANYSKWGISGFDWLAKCANYTKWGISGFDWLAKCANYLKWAFLALIGLPNEPTIPNGHFWL